MRKNTSITVITFWGKLFWRKVSFSPDALHLFAVKVCLWCLSYACASLKFGKRQNIVNVSFYETSEILNNGSKMVSQKDIEFSRGAYLGRCLVAISYMNFRNFLQVTVIQVSFYQFPVIAIRKTFLQKISFFFPQSSNC